MRWRILYDFQPIEKAEETFFQALRTKNTAALRDLLIHNFILVDVFKGQEIDKTSLLAVLETGRLTFETAIQPVGHSFFPYR